MTESTDRAITIPIEAVLPGDTITRHPDTGAPGEWTVTAVRRVGQYDRLVRLDYFQPDGSTGCVVTAAKPEVHVWRPRGAPWLASFSADEQHMMLIWLIGWSPTAFARAAAEITGQRDLVQALAARREVAS